MIPKSNTFITENSYTTATFRLNMFFLFALAVKKSTLEDTKVLFNSLWKFILSLDSLHYLRKNLRMIHS